jgi:hypothetical protein
MADAEAAEGLVNGIQLGGDAVQKLWPLEPQLSANQSERRQRFPSLAQVFLNKMLMPRTAFLML